MLIKECCSIVNEKIKSNEICKNNYISTENMISNFGGVNNSFSIPTGKVTKIQPNDILISNIRPYFKKIWFSSLEGACSSDVICLRTNDKINAKFIYYSLTTDRFINKFVKSSKGTKMPRGDKAVLLNYSISNRTDEEQQHIVDTIGSVDNLIEKYDSLITNYTRILELKFLSMLQQEMDIYYLHQICDIKYGTSISASNLTYNYKYPVYGANGVIGTLPTYEHENYKISISCRGAASGNIILTEPESTISSNSLYLNLFNDNNKFYIYQYLKHSKLQNSSTGSAQPQITIENIKTLEIKIPKNKSNYNMEDEILVLISKHKKQISILRNIKQALLSKYF